MIIIKHVEAMAKQVAEMIDDTVKLAGEKLNEGGEARLERRAGDQLLAPTTGRGAMVP